MAEVPDLYMRVQIDPDRLEKLNDATKQFKSCAEALQDSILDLRNALHDMEEFFIVTRVEKVSPQEGVPSGG